jgi:hypothetical protein
LAQEWPALFITNKKGEHIMINPAIINRFTKGSRPRVLVVTDMWFSKNAASIVRADGFSLSQFVNTLLEAGMEVTRANLLNTDGEPEGTLLGEDGNGFKFDDPNDGLSREKYDVCFIFTFEDEARSRFGVPILEDSELAAIKRFMEEGGGVFATGDHEDLGARTAKDIPRVRNMRKWFWDQFDRENPTNAPSADLSNRLSTMLSGDDEIYEFADESDAHPQRVYLNRRTSAGGLGYPHPLMQAKDSNGNNVAIVHIPDHPHEGECVIPENLETTFDLDGETRQEWPMEIGDDNRVSPEIVAKSMSHGGEGFGKLPLEPREFIAIAAYDGHRAGVGRVVTDATWHHFLDINIDGTGRQPLYNGLRNTDGTDKPELVLLRQHWQNLAEWLMPLQDSRPAAVISIAAAEKSILMDELVSLAPDELGVAIKMNLDKNLLPYKVNDLIETVVAMGISDPAARKAVTPKQTTAALGAFAAALSKQNAGDTDEVILANLAEAVKASLQQP